MKPTYNLLVQLSKTEMFVTKKISFTEENLGEDNNDSRSFAKEMKWWLGYKTGNEREGTTEEHGEGDTESPEDLRKDGRSKCSTQLTHTSANPMEKT